MPIKSELNVIQKTFRVGTNRPKLPQKIGQGSVHVLRDAAGIGSLEPVDRGDRGGDHDQ